MSLNEYENNTAAGIVLYNPELKRLQENIGHIINQVDKVLLFDNGSDNISNIEELINVWTGKVVLLKNKSNIGIAAALNRLCRWCFERGYRYIITLDHDSVCPDGIVDTLMRDMEPTVAIAAPNIVYRNNESFAEKKQGKEDVDWVITSASFTNLAVWDKLDGFDEKLFIDGVDRDFCQRARIQGYRIIKDYDVQLLHELGNLRCRKLCGRIIYVTNHSPMRKYYMVRNSIYLDKKHGEKRRFSCIAKNILKTLVYEDQKISKMKSICKGIRDGYRM